MPEAAIEQRKSDFVSFKRPLDLESWGTQFQGVAIHENTHVSQGNHAPECATCIRVDY